MLRTPGDVTPGGLTDMSEYIVMLYVTFLWILNVVILVFLPRCNISYCAQPAAGETRGACKNIQRRSTA